MSWLYPACAMLSDIYWNSYWYFLAGVLILFLVLLLYLKHCKVFSSIIVEIRRPPFKCLEIAYKFTRGPVSSYRKILAEAKVLVPNLNTLAIYQEDEKEESLDGMNYTVGVILQGHDPEADKGTYTKLAEHGYLFVRFPAVDYVVMASFPHVNQLSDVVGVARVYPLLRKFLKGKRICAHPIMEIYTELETLFIAPLSKQLAFYVPESLPIYESSESDTEEELEYFSAPPSCATTKSPVPKRFSCSHFASGILKNVCYCDTLLRSHSCDYCRRAL